MPTTVAGAPTTRTWRSTAALVTLAVLLMLIQGLGALFAGATFMGSRPTYDDYVSAAMACLTTLPAFAALIWWGWQRGSRLGIWLIAGPATVMLLVGLDLLATTRSSHGTFTTRSPNLGDLSSGGSLLNWWAVVVFVACAAATQLRRRRARHTENASAA